MRTEELLSEVLNTDNYTCIREEVTQFGETLSDRHYVEGTWVLLRLLSDFGKQSTFDFDSSGSVGTIDITKFLTGFNSPPIELPDFSWFNTGQVFGEGNEWLTSNNENVLFGWLHRTPFDEKFVSYNGYELNSFILDVVQADNVITKLTFIKRGELYPKDEG